MSARDAFPQELRGKNYIEARGLPAERARAAHDDCPACRQAEMLPAVQRILASWPTRASNDA